MGSEGAELLIISNYTHHLHEKKIHHIIYIKKNTYSLQSSLQDVNCWGIATIGNIDTTMSWYYISCVLLEGRSNHNQDHL